MVDRTVLHVFDWSAAHPANRSTTIDQLAFDESFLLRILEVVFFEYFFNVFALPVLANKMSVTILLAFKFGYGAVVSSQD